MYTAQELCHGHPETKLENLGQRSRGQPRHNVGHHRLRRLQVRLRQLHCPSPTVHLQIPNQEPHRSRPFKLTGNREVRLHHARQLARPPAPPHCQNRGPSASRGDFPPLLGIPFSPCQWRLQKALPIYRKRR